MNADDWKKIDKAVDEIERLNQLVQEKNIKIVKLNAKILILRLDNAHLRARDNKLNFGK